MKLWPSSDYGSVQGREVQSMVSTSAGLPLNLLF